MDRTSWVDGYAWFGVMENLNGVNPVSPDATCNVDTQAMLNAEQMLLQANAMMTPNGKINALGRQYIGAASVDAGDIQSSTASRMGAPFCLGTALAVVLIVFLI